MVARLSRISLLLILLIALGTTPVRSLAQDAAPFPTSELPNSTLLNFLVSGALDAGFPDSARLVFERFTLDEGDLVPTEGGPQILINVSGNLTTTDDLGLKAAVARGTQYFAPAGAVEELVATERTTLLRARIADDSPNADASITITEDACTPTMLEVPAGGTMLIVNKTNRQQEFQISSLDIETSIEPNDSSTIDLSGARVGSWSAKCGIQQSGNRQISPVTVQITEPSDIPTPATADPAQENQTILLDMPIEPGTAAATMYVASLTLDATGSAGEQTFSGPTAIVSTSQPLTITRSGRLPATLPVASSVAIPVGATITFANAALSPTEVYVVGLADSDSSIPATPPAEDDTRPTSRDSDADTADSAVEPTSTPTKSDSEQEPVVELTDFLPASGDVVALGYDYLATEPRFDYDDSLFTAFEDSSTIAGWEEGLTVAYTSSDGNAYLVFQIDHFASAADANRMIDDVGTTTELWGTSTPAPRIGNADDVVAVSTELESGSQIGVQITGRFGSYLVTALWLGPSYVEAMPDLRAAWALIDATQEP